MCKKKPPPATTSERDRSLIPDTTDWHTSKILRPIFHELSDPIICVCVSVCACVYRGWGLVVVVDVAQWSIKAAKCPTVIGLYYTVFAYQRCDVNNSRFLQIATTHRCYQKWNRHPECVIVRFVFLGYDMYWLPLHRQEKNLLLQEPIKG